MSGFMPIHSPPVRVSDLASVDSTAVLNQFSWQKNDLPVPSTHASTDPGWRGKVSNWIRRTFPPSDVVLSRNIQKYRLRLEANDLSGSAKCAYRLGYELWQEKRYSTAEHLWYTGASHFIAAAGKADPSDANEILHRLIRDGIVSLHPLKWKDDRLDHVVSLTIGAGHQGEASKLFGQNLIVKTPRSHAQMDPRSTGIYSSDTLRHFRRLNLGREIDTMLALKEQGFHIAEIHYVDPDYLFGIKDLVVGPNIRGLYSYGLTEEQIEIAEKKFRAFIARDPAMDNLQSNTLYDVNTGEWTIIDA